MGNERNVVGDGTTALGMTATPVDHAACEKEIERAYQQGYDDGYQEGFRRGERVGRAPDPAD